MALVRVSGPTIEPVSEELAKLVGRRRHGKRITAEESLNLYGEPPSPVFHECPGCGGDL